MNDLTIIQDRINKIKTYEENIKGSYWNIGKELKEIKENGLYKELGYKNIVEFGEAELSYKKSMIYNLLKIADLEYSNMLEKKSFRELLSLTSEEEKKENTEELIALLRDSYPVKLWEKKFEMAGITTDREKMKYIYDTLCETYNRFEKGKEIIELEIKYQKEIIENMPDFSKTAFIEYHRAYKKGLL